MYQEIWDYIYPRRCPVCMEILQDQKRGICPHCGKKLRIIQQPYCYKCGKVLASAETEYCDDCRKLRPAFDRGFSIVEYNKYSAPSIMAIKYKNKRIFLEFYSQLGKELYEEQLKRLHIEAIVPVPLAKKKKRKRGYNQAEVFGREISRWLLVPVKGNLLIRNKETTPLKELNPLERRRALLKVFGWNARAYEGERRVLLVDDIYTSGATAHACARILKANGIEKVYVLTIAIGYGTS